MLKAVKHRQWWKVGNYPTNYACWPCGTHTSAASGQGARCPRCRSAMRNMGQKWRPGKRGKWNAYAGMPARAGGKAKGMHANIQQQIAVANRSPRVVWVPAPATPEDEARHAAHEVYIAGKRKEWGCQRAFKRARAKGVG